GPGHATAWDAPEVAESTVLQDQIRVGITTIGGGARHVRGHLEAHVQRRIEVYEVSTAVLNRGELVPRFRTGLPLVVDTRGAHFPVAVHGVLAGVRAALGIGKVR